MQILQIHGAKISSAADMDVDKLAQITTGFSGADLANLMNEAALLAVRRGAQKVAMRNLSSDIENLIDVEIRRLLDDGHKTALELLTTHAAALREIARVLQRDAVSPTIAEL